MNAVATKPRTKKVKVNVPASPPAVVAEAILAALQPVKSSYEAGDDPDTVCIHGHTLIDLAIEELQRLASGTAADEQDSVHRAAALIAGALAFDTAHNPKCVARHAALGQAANASESAAISFGFAEEPCEMLANGVLLGRSLPRSALQTNMRIKAAGDEFDTYCLMLQAQSVAEAAAENTHSDALWGFESLVSKAADVVYVAMAPCPPDRRKLQDASDELAGALGIFDVLNTDCNEAMLFVAETLLRLTKLRIDASIEDLPQ